MDMNEQNLNRQMLNVHPDHALIHGFSSEYAKLRSQRLNDAVQEMYRHLDLPPSQNIFDTIAVKDNNSEDNNG